MRTATAISLCICAFFALAVVGGAARRQPGSGAGYWLWITAPHFALALLVILFRGRPGIPAKLLVVVLLICAPGLMRVRDAVDYLRSGPEPEGVAPLVDMGLPFLQWIAVGVVAVVCALAGQTEKQRRAIEGIKSGSESVTDPSARPVPGVTGSPWNRPPA